MSNPNPSPSTRWKPGQSGNPAGSSKKARVTDALIRMLDRLEGADEDLARTWFAMATGRKELLRDKQTGEMRKPDFPWFATLLERIEGKVGTTFDLESLGLKVIVEHRDEGIDDPDAAAPSGAGVDPAGPDPV